MLKQLNSLATSPFMIGVMILLTNVASRYVTHEFSSNDEEYSQNILLRRLVIFAICFVGTRDLVVSIILTAGFVILASGFIRGNSQFSKEGMEDTSEGKMRKSAGLKKVDQPAYDSEYKPLFGDSGK
jgi:hypothetical protein